MNKTRIDWCDYSWNPVTGCRNTCDYCYAAKLAARFEPKDKDWADGQERKHSTTGNGLHVLNEPLEVNRKDGKGIRTVAFPFGFEPTIYPYRMHEPEQVDKPSNVFVGSMTDMFGDWMPDTWINEVLLAAQAVKRHNYLFLTKNPGRYARLVLPSSDNFWYGTSVTKAGDRYWWSDKCHTFISAEPLLGPMSDLKDMPEWMVVGTMTGPGSRQRQPERKWIADIVDQCRDKCIPIFMKKSCAPLWGGALVQEFPAQLKKGE